MQLHSCHLNQRGISSVVIPAQATVRHKFDPVVWITLALGKPAIMSKHRKCPHLDNVSQLSLSELCKLKQVIRNCFQVIFGFWFGTRGERVETVGTPQMWHPIVTDARHCHRWPAMVIARPFARELIVFDFYTNSLAGQCWNSKGILWRIVLRMPAIRYLYWLRFFFRYCLFLFLLHISIIVWKQSTLNSNNTIIVRQLISDTAIHSNDDCFVCLFFFLSFFASVLLVGRGFYAVTVFMSVLSMQ